MGVPHGAGAPVGVKVCPQHALCAASVSLYCRDRGGVSHPATSRGSEGFVCGDLWTSSPVGGFPWGNEVECVHAGDLFLAFWSVGGLRLFTLGVFYST